MSTIADLIMRMREHAWHLEAHAERAGAAGADIEGWTALAGSAARTLRMLEVDAPTSDGYLWEWPVERHESVARRICELLTDLGETPPNAPPRQKQEAENDPIP